MAVKSIAHVCLNVTNVEASLRFYCDQLGLRKAFDFLRKDGSRMGAYVAFPGGGFIEMFESPGAFEGRPNITHLCIEVDDIQESVRELNARGVETTPVKLGCDQSYQTWIKDPDGTRIELHQYTPASSQRTGAACRVDWK